MRLTKGEQKKIALERIDYLFSQALHICSKKPDLADRYIHLALKLRDRIKVKLTVAQKMKFCKECMSYFAPGKFIARTKNKMLLLHCKRCGAVRKFGIGTKNEK